MSSLRFPRFTPAAIAVSTLFVAAAAAVSGASGCAVGENGTTFTDAGTRDASVPGDDDDDDDDSPPPRSGDAGSDSGDGGRGDSGGDGGDSGPVRDAGMLGPTSGTITLTQTESQEQTFTHALAVAFSQSSPDGGVCTTETVTPACVLTICNGADAGSGNPVSAGTVTVGEPDASVSSTPIDEVYPPPTPASGQIFEPGDLVTASAAGEDGGLGGFMTQAIGPNEILVTMPSPLAGASFPRSEPLMVAWENGLDGTGEPGASTSVVVVVATNNAGATKTVTCTFAASEESGAVPLSGANGDYIDQAGTGGVTGTISLTPTSDTQLIAGPGTVLFTVIAGVQSGTFTTTD